MTTECCNENGHTPDWSAATYAGGTNIGFSGPVFDVPCADCGRSGSFVVSSDAVNWE